MVDVRTDGAPGRHRAGPVRTSRNGSSTSGRKRWAAGAAAAAVAAGSAGLVVPSASADVRDGRAIEIFHGRNIVGLDGYPANTQVKTQVFRGEREIGFATLTTDSTGFLEINHVGGTDCWQSQYTPDIRPGDVVRTTVPNETPQDFSVTRDVFINQDAAFLPGNIIRVTGHAKSTSSAPIAGGDAVELRMNKVSRTNNWETSDPPGRRDLRLEDVRPFLRADGTYTYDFAVSADDWNDAQTTGIDISTVWLRGVTETAEATELTFYDGEPEPTEGCPKTVNDFDPPSVPGNVQALPVGADGTRITWAEATDDVAVTGYTIYRNGVEVGTTRVTATNKGLLFNDGPLVDGVYEYTVTANDATPNHSARSAVGSVTVGGPAAPTAVSATAGVSAATVSWTAPTNPGSSAITGYKVRVFQDGTEVGAARDATGSPFEVTGLTNGVPYTFRVAAVNSVGTGVYSAHTTPVSPTGDPEPPTAPANLSAVVTGSSVALTWDAATDNVGVTGYQVLRGPTVVGTVTGTTFTNTSVPAGTHSYTVRARDAVGNLSVASNAVSVTVASTNVAPTVSGRTPRNNAFSVGLAANVRATFSEVVTGVTTGTFQVRNRAGTVIPGAVTRNPNNTRQWILNPTNNLAADTRYTVTLTGGTTAIRDLQGAALVGTTAQPLTWSFTTGPAPRLSARTPGVNATGVNRTANVTATFNERVQGVSGSTVRLTNAATGAAVTAVVSYNATTRVATLNPSATLAANTSYRVNLIGRLTGIRDLAGNPLANIGWTFRTGG